MHIETRWMRREDVPQAVKMMQDNGEDESEKGLKRMLDKASVACVVAESEDKFLGFLMYDVARVSKIKVISLMVDENHRRQGVGTRMIYLATSKLNPKRNKVELVVSEYNLGAQLFLRSMGFKAVSVVDRSPDPSEYKFVYRFSQMVEEGV
jgi:ribosomal protein S18 acetylase RimI-like enzyme